MPRGLPLPLPLPPPLVAPQVSVSSKAPDLRESVSHTLLPGQGPSQVGLSSQAGSVPTATRSHPRQGVCLLHPAPGLGPPRTVHCPAPRQTQLSAAAFSAEQDPHPRPALSRPRHRPAGPRGAVSAGPGCGKAVLYLKCEWAPRAEPEKLFSALPAPRGGASAHDVTRAASHSCAAESPRPRPPRAARACSLPTPCLGVGVGKV